MVEPKKQPDPDRDTQFEIQYINDDGSVGISEVGDDGVTSASIKIVELDEFMATYRVCKDRIKLMEGHPGNSVLVSPEMGNMLDHATAAIALRMLIHKCDVYKKMTWRIQKQPTLRVRTGTKVKAGALIIPPATPKISLKTGMQGGVDVEIEGRVGAQLLRCVDEKCVGEFWLIQTKPDEKICNMAIQLKELDVPLPACIGGHRKVRIPCAVNTKAIDAGGELIIYKTPVKKEAAPGSGCIPYFLGWGPHEE